jgi:hypothetical protein
MVNLRKLLMQTTPEQLKHAEDALLTNLRSTMTSMIESPQTVNTQIGRTMQHIGDTLVIASANYLPLQKDEILVEPNVIKNTEALVLTNRQIQTNDSFLVIAYRSGNTIDCTCIAPDRYDLRKTRFVTLNESASNEMLRQLNIVFDQRPASLQITVCGLIVDNFFPVTPVEKLPKPESSFESAGDEDTLPAPRDELL